MRKCFEKEFSSIYIFNLRGNQRTSGEISRKEGGKIFGSGSRAPIAITILVKKPKKDGEKAAIYYREVGDYLTRAEKLEATKTLRSAAASVFTQRVLKPNAAGDWLNQRSDFFTQFTAMAPFKKFDEKALSVFNVYSLGICTNRDAWVYNFSADKAYENAQKSIAAYNHMVKSVKNESDLDRDPQHISWSSNLFAKWKSGHWIDENILDKTAAHRPFCKKKLMWQDELINRKGLFKEFFPKPDSKNRLICICGVGSRKPFSALLTDKISDLQLVENAQCFPLYWYEEDKGEGEIDMFAEKKDDGPRYVRKDGITDYIWNLAKEQYHTSAISKEDLFYYVYGLLHSEDYRKEFAADLKKMLPRIPLVEKESDFKAFMKAGRALADLHLHYEDEEPPEGVIVEKEADDYHVTKMRFGGKKDKSVILYNDAITIRNIPLTAYDYIVNGRSAIEWVMESYRVKADKASGIVNDPNDWAKEHDDPAYILRLLLSVITVSEKTLAITSALPRIHFKKEE